MKNLFIQFLKIKAFRDKVNESTPAEASTMFNAWMMATMNKPTEFANKFMVRKWILKLTA